MLFEECLNYSPPRSPTTSDQESRQKLRSEFTSSRYYTKMSSRLSRPQTISETTSTGNDSGDSIPAIAQTDDEARLLHVQLSTVSTGMCTQAYQQALANRIHQRLITDKGKYNTNEYPPVIVHDIMMLPGSLAALIGKDSPIQLIPRMTPALLCDIKAHVIPDTLQPCLSRRPASQGAYTHGMLVFGLSKETRKLIHQHYRPHAKRKSIPVEAEVKVLTPDEDGQTSWKLERRAMRAHAWLCNNNGKGAHRVVEGATWTLEDYLEGKLEPKQTVLRIEPNMRGDEDDDGFIGREVEETILKREVREEVQSGPGEMEVYTRIKGCGFSGW
ncbi:Hypothetical predicted protein [Lecanosticta acicola]|uniref:Uncharacterized protein n=1 Tax=Lecanosticta acicola TaxID=111012 RepID=A0AAI8Z7S8_9PEZI|nr:Hypothetical predicted protein [Lecanosticta acicola]